MKRADDENIFLVEMALKMYQSLHTEGYNKVTTKGVIDTLEGVLKTMQMGEKSK